MIQGSSNDSALTLLLIEAGLTSITVAAAFCWPRFASSLFRRAERAFSGLARRKRTAVAVVGASMLAMRLILLPLFPPPLPNSTDDFSFLLAADTFLHGRLANPTPVMWTHLESIHVTMAPTYASMYFPGPGLVMAAGKLLFGNPWAGVLITGALMCAALCWMLQAWLPPGWALLGGFIAVLRIGLFSYWVNSYTGGATLSALGGALVLGALPRLLKTARFRYAMLMAIGMVLLALTRPYEGFLLCLPVAVALGYWILKGKSRPNLSVVFRRAALPLALIVAALAWLGYYDHRAFGKATTLPYTIDRAAYAVVPYYIWQPAHPVPHYRHAEMRRFYTESEAKHFDEYRSIGGFLHRNFSKALTTVTFFAGFALLPAIFLFRRVAIDRRLRFLVWCTPFWIVGMGIGVFLIPHYLAPFTAAVYALGLQAFRHLRQWKPGARPAGVALLRYTVIACLLMTCVRVAAVPLHLEPPQWPLGPWLCTWIGPGHFGADRAAAAAQLDRLPGRHLVFVRYSLAHEPGDEWVYNGADIDGSKTVWAREMSPADDEAIIRYYADRDVWLVQPDDPQHRLTLLHPASNLDNRLLAAGASGSTAKIN